MPKYRVILQFALAPRDVAQFDRLTEVEDRLAKQSLLFEVEGHDCATGGMNINLLTDDPERSYEIARALIPSCCSYRAGFRSTDSEEALQPLAV